MILSSYQTSNPRYSVLLTDLYQLTMAYGYWKTGWHEKEAVFNLSFRKNPFNGGFSIACGLATVIDFLNRYVFQSEDIDYLKSLTGYDGSPLFQTDFLKYLRELKLVCDVDSFPEGVVVFPHEPLVRVQGPIIQCQLLETALLNIINFQSLIATKAARVCLAAGGDPVLEFGLRRAQGSDGGLTASRAAYIGGCAATSNMLAGKYFGIPVRGTHAHSWIMAFENEQEAFRNYVAAMPNNCVFLVDTFDTLEGIKHAVGVGSLLRETGHELVGIRLDSGDLDCLSRQARKILDKEGFSKTIIMASNDLDEHSIDALKQREAPIGVWGVGTKLVTADGQSALGGVYKLTAIRGRSDSWEYRVKLSEQTSKITIPGILQVRRFEKDGKFVGDLIYDEAMGMVGNQILVDPNDTNQRTKLPTGATFQDLLVPIMRKGQLVFESPPITQSREQVQQQLARFDSRFKRLTHSETYPVGLELGLHKLRERLIQGGG